MVSLSKKILFFLCWSSCLLGIENETETGPEIVLIPVASSIEPEKAFVHILSPLEGETKSMNPVKIDLEIQGLCLGTQSDDEKNAEIAHEPGVQTLHIIVDNHPYFSLYDPSLDAEIGVREKTGNQKISFEIPFSLEPGMHILRIFPTHSFQEGMKNSDVFATRFFYFKTRKNNPELDLTKPYLTYNQPQGKYEYSIDKPILLDFYVSHCTLSPKGYKVRVLIDNTFIEDLSEPGPYYLYGLQKGAHKIELQLIDSKSNLLPGLLTHEQKVITLY